MMEKEFERMVYANILSMIDDAMAAYGKEMAEARLKELTSDNRNERLVGRLVEFPSEMSIRVTPIKLSREQMTVLSDIIEESKGNRRVALVELYNELKKPEVQRPELTWRDMRRIIGIADRLIDEKPEEELVAMGEKGFYEEVLRRFNERRKK